MLYPTKYRLLKKFIGGVRSRSSVAGRGEGKSESQNDLARLEAATFEIEERKCKGFESLGSISQRLSLALF